jgi:hypothetical protein
MFEKWLEKQEMENIPYASFVGSLMHVQVCRHNTLQ